MLKRPKKTGAGRRLTPAHKLPRAKKFFVTLNRQNLFSIYYRLHSAKKPETRAKRMTQILSMLDNETKLH
nr:YdeI/OmpD-associated family protein [Acidisarcina polymorpha]